MIRIATKDLVALLGDLMLTTAAEDSAHPLLASVLLYTDRGYAVADDPGKSDVLVGISTNRRLAGHTFTACDGQMTPTLWPVSKVASVIQVFKPKLKADKEHGVIITRAGDHVTVQEDPNLFDDGDRIEFKSGDLTNYPGAKLAELIADMPTNLRGVMDHRPKPRTDFYSSELAILCKIATNRKRPILTYRTHQDDRVLVQIGDYWRGWIKPIPYEVNKTKVGDLAYRPEAEVFTPDMPAPEEDALADKPPTTSPTIITTVSSDPVLPLEDATLIDEQPEPVGVEH